VQKVNVDGVGLESFQTFSEFFGHGFGIAVRGVGTFGNYYRFVTDAPVFHPLPEDEFGRAVMPRGVETVPTGCDKLVKHHRRRTQFL
jgi:hypothetical protein